MSQDQREYGLALEALRGEQRSARDKERVRERLVMRGVTMGAVLGSAPATAAALKASSSVGWAMPAKLLASALVVTALGVVAVRPSGPEPAPGLSVSRGALTEGRERESRALRFEQHAPEANVEPQASAQRAPARAHRKADARADLAREIALLSGAANALRAGELAAAARLLDQHEREFPAGFLRAERESARGRLVAAQAPGSTGKP